jgi:hypothetical protein
MTPGYGEITRSFESVCTIAAASCHKKDSGSERPRLHSIRQAVLIARFPQIRRTSRKPAGFEFIDEKGGGPGVRLRKPQRSKKSK